MRQSPDLSPEATSAYNATESAFIDEILNIELNGKEESIYERLSNLNASAEDVLAANQKNVITLDMLNNITEDKVLYFLLSKTPQTLTR